MRKLGAAIAAGTVALVVAGWFYRPSTSGEWAAWVQTLGVLAAILWAVRLQMASSKQSLLQAGQVAAMFANNMHWVFRELNDACGKRSWDDYTVHRRILHEVLAQGREVTLQLLDGRSLAMVSSLRTIAVEALEMTEGHGEDGNWGRLHNYFDRRLPSISAWMSATGNPPESSGPTDYAGLRTSFG
ncbi:hypothetical protein QTH97_12590 [Variovorax sp. J22R24]|uniref:hypothetical protein n=1 Tax=Variovorax gracilis TaxID=3053502 RepID=UPI002576FED0|nr:hypothetical protein [Variovorax sp. J22R24]MDM0105777.1 hypothetical protein [Variovorax sp. J22R24]